MNRCIYCGASRQVHLDLLDHLDHPFTSQEDDTRMRLRQTIVLARSDRMVISGPEGQNEKQTIIKLLEACTVDEDGVVHLSQEDSNRILGERIGL